MPVLPKDRRCLQSKAKAKPGERKTPVDAQEGGEKEEDWEIAEGKKKEEEKEEGKEVAFRASSFKSGQADPLEEEEKASLAASEALALNKGQGEPKKICNQKILTKKDLPPKKNFEQKKSQALFSPCFFNRFTSNWACGACPEQGPEQKTGSLEQGQSTKQVSLNKGQEKTSWIQNLRVEKNWALGCVHGRWVSH